MRDLLFHEDYNIREKATAELTMYFQKIAQASLGDLFDLNNNDAEMSMIKDVLCPPSDQDLRHMRHHIHCQDLHGIIGHHPQPLSCIHVNSKSCDKHLNSNTIVRNNTKAILDDNTCITNYSDAQLDILAYSYPYHMEVNNCMRPSSVQNTEDAILNSQSSSSANKIMLFNLRHPLLQLRFNIHDCYHRPSCFKKGPECRTELPQKHKSIATIQFDERESIIWHCIDGSTKEIKPFKYYPKRNIGDQFMNINNDIATTVLACNNNVTIGDKACFFMLHYIKQNIIKKRNHLHIIIYVLLFLNAFKDKKVY